MSDRGEAVMASTRMGSSPYVTKEHDCFWFNGANGDPLAGLLCLHGYRPQTPVENRKGVNQTATVMIRAADRRYD